MEKKIKHCLKEKGKYVDEIVDEFLELYSLFPLYSSINPAKFSIKLEIDDNEVFNIFSYLVNLGAVKPIYKLICPNCKRVTRDSFEDFKELEDYEECEICGESFSKIDNKYKYIIILYKVIKK